MPAPLNPNLWASVLHDQDGIPISASNPLPVGPGGGGPPINVNVVGVTPGTVITTEPDVVVGIAAIVPLTAPPAGTRRMTIQNTGPGGSVIRVRELGGTIGSGIKLVIYAQETYGGADGALAPLEVEEVAGIATSVSIQFERD